MSTFGPDADLIAACTAFASHDEAGARPADDDEDDAADDAAAGLVALMRPCADLRATTLAGHQARANALRARIGEWPEPGPMRDCFGDPLLAALLRDLVADPPPAD